MQHKANNALLRGLRFKAIQPSGHVTTLPDAFRRLLSHPTHCPFAPRQKKIKLFVAQHEKPFASRQGISFWAHAGMPAAHSLMPVSFPGAHAAYSHVCPCGLMK